MRHVFLVLGVALVAVFVPATACLSQQADVRTTFLASNPNDGWEYGFINGSGDLTLYNSTFDDKRGIAGWCKSKSPGPHGAILINCTDQSIERYGTTWLPGMVCMHPAMNGGGVSIRWRSTFSGPASLSFALTAGTQDLDVYAVVTVNNESIYEGEICNIVDSSYICNELSRTSTISVREGDYVAVTIFCVGGQAGVHIGAYLNVSPMSGSNGATFGIKPLAKQVFSGPSWEVPTFESVVFGERS